MQNQSWDMCSISSKLFRSGFHNGILSAILASDPFRHGIPLRNINNLYCGLVQNGMFWFHSGAPEWKLPPNWYGNRFHTGYLYHKFSPEYNFIEFIRQNNCTCRSNYKEHYYEDNIRILIANNVVPEQRHQECLL